MITRRTALAALAAAAFAPPAGAATLDEIATAMGATQLASVQYSGSGFHYLIGQSMRAGGEWPRFPLTRVVRNLDFANAAMTEDYVFVQRDGPLRGGGAQPVVGESRRVLGVAGDRAWSGAAQVPTAAPAQLVALQHELWIAAHGIVKAALADKAAVETIPSGTRFAIERPGRFKARATANAANLIERVDSVIANPVLGDMEVTTLYADYKDFGGVKFPTKIIQTVQGSTSLEVNIADVKVNAGAVAAPAQTQPAVPVPAATIEKAAEGVWFVAGASHHSVAIEMADHVILFEAPLGDARVNEVIELVKKTVPGKPLRMVVNSHHHFDHSGGLRAAAAEGMTIVTHELNLDYFQRAYAPPRTVGPDRLARAGASARFQAVGDKLVLGDAARPLELHVLRDLAHVDGMLIGYLPREKILLVADAFSPRQPEPFTRPVETPHPYTVTLWDNVQRLKLDVATVLPVHGRIAKGEELRFAAGR